MIHGERRIVKFRQKDIREDVHLVQTVLFCDLWKTIADSAELVLNYPRKMVRGSEGRETVVRSTMRSISVGGNRPAWDSSEEKPWPNIVALLPVFHVNMIVPRPSRSVIYE